MLVQYTAAALVNENKGYAWPSSVDSIPTSAGQEDHVSMGMTSANNLPRVLTTSKGRWPASCSARLPRPIFGDRSNPATELKPPMRRRAKRSRPGLDDRPPAPDIAAARELIRRNASCTPPKPPSRIAFDQCVSYCPFVTLVTAEPEMVEG